MNLRVVILPAKVLANGTHRVRIAISHRGQTRYLMTRFIVPEVECLRNGTIVGVNNASYINQQLRIRMNRIYTICDKATDIDYLTCSQLVQYIENKESNSGPKTIHEIGERFLNMKQSTHAEGTLKLYRDAIAYFEQFFGSDYLLQLLSADDLFSFRNWLKEKRGLSQTTISIKERNLHTVINYAIKMKYALFEVSPYSVFSDTPPTVRDCRITIEQLRMIRDLKLDGRRDYMTRYARDLFMLSFYLCGMNLADMMSVDLSGDSVKYMRQKTKARRKTPRHTEFTIQPEAKEIIDRLMVNGKIVIKYERSYDAVSRILHDCLPRIAKQCGIQTQFIFYSARKTFAQLANELFVKDNVIEYCIGDTVTPSKKVIGYYINVTKRMADMSIRRVFDAVASDKSIEQLSEEIMGLPLGKEDEE